MRESNFHTVAWSRGEVVLLDQRLLPDRERYLRLRDAESVARAIETMAVRGAPAIGVTAALGLALGARRLAGMSAGPSRTGLRAGGRRQRGGARRTAGRGADGGRGSRREIDAFGRGFERLCRRFASTRPTAVNLFWAIERMRRVSDEALRSSAPEEKRGRRKSRREPGAATNGLAGIARRLEREALAIQREDVEANRRMGRHGASLVPRRATILTHCNAGALATAGYGTALGVIRAAREAGKRVDVLADETRPFLQGARLTAWELQKDRIPVRLITDSMAGHFLKGGGVDLIVVGADRIASNGDVANKIGTYSVAVLARENGVPFYVAAPLSTLDPRARSGADIPIEERSASEVTSLAGRRIAPRGVKAEHPAFDVTPARLVTAIITEAGVARPPYRRSLAALLRKGRTPARSTARRRP